MSMMVYNRFNYILFLSITFLSMQMLWWYIGMNTRYVANEKALCRLV